MQTFCSECGATLITGAKFCGSCGKPVSHLSSPSAPGSSSEKNARVDVSVVSSSETTGSKFSAFLKSGIVFVAAYILAIVPTYVLPYTGSNSSIAGAAGAIAGLGFLPQFWAHLGFLCFALVLAWFRGVYIGKPWIAIFPFFAGIFDMVPGFNWLYFVPTLFHIVTLVMGVRGKLTGGVVLNSQAMIGAVILAVPLALFLLQWTKYNTRIAQDRQSASSKSSNAAPPPSQSRPHAPPTSSPTLKEATVIAMAAPPKTLTQTDECLLYKCSGARGSAKRDLGIFSSPDISSRRVGDLRVGEGFLIENGAWRTIAPRIIKVNKPTRTDKASIAHIRPGDVLHFYASWGEGCMTTWLRGNLFGYFNEGHRPPGLKANIACLMIESEDVLTIEEGRSEQWVKGRSDRGITGWVRRDIGTGWGMQNEAVLEISP